MDRNTILHWLREDNTNRLKTLWQLADTIRRENVGQGVHLRGIIEISNHCVRRCSYCGINADNKTVSRYRMPAEKIIAVSKQIADAGYGTVVLQSGEDFDLDSDWVGNLVKSIKDETGLAVTLSLGERRRDEFLFWKQCGADRYLLKLETGNPDLYKHIHPNGLRTEWSGRQEILTYLIKTGYETGSGIMVGIPGQSYEDVANNLLLLRDLGVHMLGIGPYIPHPQTPLAAELALMKKRSAQVPNSELMTYKVNALARILCPKINIPTTTALATLNSANGRELGLCRGANVIMPNFTPLEYRRRYEIYPGRVCLNESGDWVQKAIRQRIESVGRKAASGPGSALSHLTNGSMV